MQIKNALASIRVFKTLDEQDSSNRWQMFEVTTAAKITLVV